MKRRWLQTVVGILLGTLLGTAFVMAYRIGSEGMYLIGIPDADEVQRVTVAYPSVTDEVKELTDEEDIALAVKLSGFLKYELFSEADADGEPLVTITYDMATGETVTVSANRDTVWWKGKAHAIKEEETFINVMEALFFQSEMVGG
ncbi:MAG: hypothetical protein LIO78_08260 [Clostridiales bacterium]|nr:hypothetical protein [Clostridiales bacterium]